MDYDQIHFFMSTSRFKEVEEFLAEELANDPDSAMLFTMLSRVLRLQGKTQKSCEAARRAIELEPEMSDAHFELACALVERCDHKQALDAINTSIELDPTHEGFYAVRARILMEQGKNEAALESALQGLEQDPESESCRFYQGVLLGRLNRWDEANEVSLGLLNDSPDDSEHHAARGFVLLEQGNGADAEQHFLETLRLDPTNDDGRIGLAQAIHLQRPIFGLAMRFVVGVGKIPFWIYVLATLFLIRFVRILKASDIFVLELAGKAGYIVIFALALLLIANELFFDLGLYFSKRGRHAYEPHKETGLKLSLIPLGLAAISAVVWAINSDTSLPYYAFGFTFLAVLFYEAFQDQRRWLRDRLLLVAGVSTIFFLAVMANYEINHHPLATKKIAEYRQAKVEATLQQLADTFDAAKDHSEAQPDLNSEDESLTPTSPKLKQLSDELSSLDRNRRYTLHIPLLVLLILTSFSTEVREYLTKYAPDEI